MLEDMAPGSEYRFEDSPGLRHSCAICRTPLHHPRAKKTCYGKHAEPCPRFHHTMFRMGRTSSCDACKTSNEQHHKRHSAIAALVHEIHRGSNVKAPVTDLEEIANAIHGYSEASIQNDRQALDKALAKDNDLGERITQNRGKTLDEHLKNQEIRQVLSRLGFGKNVSYESNERKAMLLRLVDAIISDIETVANESRETLKRQLGYYQYADKRAYNAMTRTLNSLNLETGDSDSSAAAQEESQEDEEEEKAEDNKGDPTTDAVPGPKLEGKENKGVKKVNAPTQKNSGMKLIFVSNNPKTTALPKPGPLREKNV